MYPGNHARTNPDKPAVVMADSGESLTYAQLEDRSIRLAHVLRDTGLERGGHVALIATNSPEVFVTYWAAVRSGLYITAVNHHLSAPEAAYIVDDCGAEVLIVSADMAELAQGVARETPACVVGWRSTARSRATTPTRRRSPPRAPRSRPTSPRASTCSTARAPPGAQGHPAGAAAAPGARARRRHDGRLRPAVRVRRAHRLLLARADLPRGAAALRRHGARHRRHARAHGGLRRPAGAGAHRRARRDPLAVGADDVRADAQARRVRAARPTTSPR